MPCTRLLLALAAAFGTLAACAPAARSSSSGDSLWSWVGAAEAPIVVPRGTELRARLVDSLNSARSRAGERFVATVTKDLLVYGELALPAGTRLHGIVNEAWPAIPGGGDALLALEFRAVELPGGSISAIKASLIRTSGSRQGRRAAAAQSLLASAIHGSGRTIEEPRGAVVGSVVGSSAATGVVMAPDGEQVSLPRGTRLKVRLETSLEVPDGP